MARRFAFLLPSLKFGGAERVTLTMAAALKRRGFAVDILLMQAVGELLDEARRDFTVVDLNCGRTWQLPFRLAAYLRRARPAGLVASFWKLNLCAALARVAAPGVRLGLWEHSLPSQSPNSPLRLYRPSASLLYPLATRIIAVSDAVACDVEGASWGLRRRISVVPNPVAPPVITAAQPARDRHALLWVGRLDPRKNPMLMLEAFAQLPVAEPYTLTFLGDGPMRPALAARAAALEVAKRVRFVGFVRDPGAFMARAGVLVVSSDSEGLSLVLIEGLQHGMSLVTTDCGAVREVVDEGRYGSIVPRRDPTALAEAIAREAAAPRDPAIQRQGAARYDPALAAGRLLAALHIQETPNTKQATAV